MMKEYRTEERRLGLLRRYAGTGAYSFRGGRVTTIQQSINLAACLSVTQATTHTARHEERDLETSNGLSLEVSLFGLPITAFCVCENVDELKLTHVPPRTVSQGSPRAH